jgi:hypothetical protein
MTDNYEAEQKELLRVIAESEEHKKSYITAKVQPLSRLHPCSI